MADFQEIPFILLLPCVVESKKEIVTLPLATTTKLQRILKTASLIAPIDFGGPKRIGA